MVSKKKIEGAMHFSEIIRLQFGKKCHTLLCGLVPFRILMLLNYL